MIEIEQIEKEIEGYEWIEAYLEDNLESVGVRLDVLREELEDKKQAIVDAEEPAHIEPSLSAYERNEGNVMSNKTMNELIHELENVNENAQHVLGIEQAYATEKFFRQLNELKRDPVKKAV